MTVFQEIQSESYFGFLQETKKSFLYLSLKSKTLEKEIQELFLKKKIQGKRNLLSESVFLSRSGLLLVYVERLLWLHASRKDKYKDKMKN